MIRSLGTALVLLLALSGCLDGTGTTQGPATDGPGGAFDAGVDSLPADLSRPDDQAGDSPTPDSGADLVRRDDTAPDAGLDSVVPLDTAGADVADLPPSPDVSVDVPPVQPPSPDLAGPFPVESSTVSVTTGGKALDVTVVLPGADGPFPVVVFTHGFQLGPAQYASYAQRLASHGFVVLLPAMPGSLFIPSTHKQLKEYLRGLLDWVDATASDAGGPLKGRADPSRLGLSGHSMGGKISLLVCAEDPRPDAAFLVDPVDAAGGPFGGNPVDYPSVTPELMPGITLPIALVGETVNATCTGFLCQACAPAGDNFHQYHLHAGGPSIEIEVLGANHMSFLDNPNCGLACSACGAGTDDPAVTRGLTLKYLTAFYRLHLLGEAAYEPWLTGPAMDTDVAAGLVQVDVKE